MMSGKKKINKNSSATPDGLVQLRWSALTHRIPTTPRPCHTYCTTHTHTRRHEATHTLTHTVPLSTDYSPCCGESVCATASAPRSAEAAERRESSPDDGLDHSQQKSLSNFHNQRALTRPACNLTPTLPSVCLCDRITGDLSFFRVGRFGLLE